MVEGNGDRKSNLAAILEDMEMMNEKRRDDHVFMD
jgi:hypothetical protein